MSAYARWNNTHLGVDKEIGHDAASTSGGLGEGRVTETKLLEQKSVVTKHVCDVLRIREWRDRVSLRIMVIRLCHDSVQVWGRDARTLVPMTRTGFLSCLGLNGGSLSTERTGHPYIL